MNQEVEFVMQEPVGLKTQAEAPHSNPWVLAFVCVFIAVAIGAIFIEPISRLFK